MATALRSEQPLVRRTASRIRPIVDGPQLGRSYFITAVVGNALAVPLRSGNDIREVEALMAQIEAVGTCTDDVFTFKVRHEADCARECDECEPCDCAPAVSVLRQTFAEPPRRTWLGALVDSFRRA